jgi:membrane fusion protein, multidrug efflux system
MPDEQQQRRPMSARAKAILWLCAAALLAAGLAWFIYYEASGRYRQSTNDAEMRADSVAISPKTTGYVTQVLVEDNEDVKAGQVLVTIDPRDYRAKVEEDESEIAVSQASTAGARASLGEQYASIEQTRVQLAQARTKAAHDAGEVARYAPLVEAGAETAEKLAQLRQTADESADDVKAKAASLLAQQRHVASLEAQIEQNEAQVRSAQAKLASARSDLDSSTLKAPFDGRVGDKTVALGEFAQPGTRLLSIVPLEDLYIVANFKETQIGLMRPGQPAKIKVDALAGVELRGRVLSVSPGTGAQFSILPPQNATGNFTKVVQRVPVKIAFEAGPEARKLLVPGLSVTVTVDTIDEKHAREKIEREQDQSADRSPHTDPAPASAVHR